MRKTLLLVLFSMLSISYAIAQRTYFDNFDSYKAGSYLGTSSSKWTTWSGNTGSSAADDTKIDTTDAYSGKNSLYFTSTTSSGGPQDIVLPFRGSYADGMFIYSMKMKIPSGKSAYFNFQGYTSWPTTGGWTTEVNFTTSGSLTFGNVKGGGSFTTSYSQGSWFTLKIIANLTLNKWQVYIDNVYKGTFANALNQVSAVDIFPSNTDASFWVDDVFYSIPALANDAGIVSIDSPSVYCLGAQRNVIAKVRNYGFKVLNNVVVNWSVNGVTQTAVKYSSAIDTMNGSKPNTASIKLGKHTFSSTADTIRVWTTLPNGVADSINMNDTFTSIKKAVSPPTAAGGGNKDVCLGSKVKIGTTAVTGNKYSWTSKPAGFTATSFNADVSPTVNTTYYLTVTNTASGCSSVDSVKVTVLPAAKADPGKDQAICEGDSVMLGGVPESTYAYSWTSTPTGFTSTKPNPYVKPTATTTYNLKVTNPSFCTDDSTVTIKVNNKPSLLGGFDKTVCKGESTQIGRPFVNGNSYSWRSIPTGFTSTSPDPVVKPTDTTRYFVMVTNASGCTIEDEVVVNVVPLPVADAGTGKDICASKQVQIGTTNQPGYSYSWSSRPAGFTSYVSDPLVSPTVTTTYKVIIRNSAGCTDEDSVTINVVPPPTANAGTAQSICLGDSAQIGTAATNGFTYSWSSTPAGFTSAAANPYVKPTETTTYKVVVTNETGCFAENNVTVTIKPNPVADAGTTKTITCAGKSAQIGTTAVSGYSYSWTSVPAGFTSQLSNPEVSPQSTTTYKLRVTDAGGCSATSEVTVNIVLPTADFKVARSGLKATFRANNTNYKLYNWNFRDGNSDTGRVVTHTFKQAGTYKVNLYVIAGDSCTTNKDSTIEISSVGIDASTQEVADIQLYPNPFTSSTTLSYTLPQKAKVYVVLMDVTGKKLAARS
ncbi:MAG: PKD domain-containing protein, partial [Sphingobacteriales bacterium]